ncbi:MAG: Hsp20/alpha crystallin family protein [bacterium]|nr:Hsp20/alpha crystallin family protein [bacterium]
MRLVKWSPMFPNRMPDFDDMFEDFAGPMAQGGFAPAIDVYEEGNNMVAEVPLPGVDTNNIEVSIENDVLSIEGKTEKKTEVDEKDYYRKEVRYGGFHRAVALPCSVDGEKAKADYNDGVLKISVPKLEVAKKKTITINK